MDLNNVRFIQNLGSGSYGEVYKAKWDGKIVAAKRIHPLLVRFDPGGENGVVARFVNECELLRRLDHPNILKVLHIIHQPRKPPILITELLDCDLGKHFSENEEDIPLEELVTIMLDVAKGLEYLHGQDVPIIHRDLCPKNILLDKSNPALLRAKICDIGLAKIMEDIRREFSPVPGTPAYMAPETYGDQSTTLPSIQTTRYGTQIDVFSFGMTLLEGIIGKPPLTTENPLAHDEETTVHSRLQEDLRKMGEANPLRQLVFDCLEDNPEQRPRIDEIVKTLSDDGFLKEIVMYDFQSQKRKVCEDFHHWIPVRRRTIRELEEMNLDEMTAALDELHRRANIATAAGVSTSVLATGLVVGGFIGSFFTFGATIPIMIAGGSIAAAGGLTTFGAKMSEIVVSKKNINKVEDAIAEDKEESENLRKSIEKLNRLTERNVQRIFDLDDPVTSGARAVGGVPAATAGARIGTAVFDTLSGFVASVLSLPIDAYFLVTSVLALRNRSPSEVAEKIRDIQSKMVCPLESEIDLLIEEYVKSKVAEVVNAHFEDGPREEFQRLDDSNTLLANDELNNAET